MDFKDLGNGRVVRQQTPRQAEPLQAQAVDFENISNGAKAILIADIVVGDASDVTAGLAHYSSIGAAITAAVAGSRIFLLKRTFTESVTVDRQVHIFGCGYASRITGNITFTSTGGHSLVRGIRIVGNITFNASSNGSIVTECWQPTINTVTDNGSGNYYAIAED